MAKFALLIGVSEYEPGLTPLPAAIRDVEAMERVLQDSEIGNFDEVKKLVNPETPVMAEAIEHLFNARQKDDLILLFFSGHGIKDESGKLYFATRNSRKTDKGLLVKATTVPASFVHDVMSHSRSKREVVILDCCFSGAFAEGMSAKDNGFVDVKNQLGGEGRAVLTSSTSTQYSFEDTGTDISTYTRYVVEGLETGAADKDEDGWITVNELHEYANRKVQEAAPAMKPEIYAIKEGYSINLAKAPNDHPHLKYRQEVYHWVKGGNGAISSIGRAVLEELKNKLEITDEEANEIETQVLAPFKIHEQKLYKYKETLHKAIKDGFRLSGEIESDLQRLQEALGLTDKEVALIKAGIIPSDDNPVFRQIWKYLIGGIICIFLGRISVGIPSPQSISKCPVNEEYIPGDRISIGEEILLTQDTNSDKQAGVKAFTQGHCTTAIKKFENYRKEEPADPEALIYLNNARAIRRGKYLKIAVSVPIGENPNVAKEMLRGVAQAQDDVNSTGSINGKLLKVAIANDDNHPNIAAELASRFVEDKNILAVVGHNSSKVSLSVARSYQQNKLVMITPTSYAPTLPIVSGDYIFRTAPSVRSIADTVSKYAVKAGKTNFLMCFDKVDRDSEEFQKIFIEAIKASGGQINPTDCNISKGNLKYEAVIDQAIGSGANALVLPIYIDRTPEALAVAQANQGRLTIFSSSTLYRDEILAEGKAINGMIIAVPWHFQAFPDNPFVKNAEEIWRGTVNWRTATSYNATKAIIAGLQKSNTREGLKEALRDSDFSFNGVTEKFKFDKYGDIVDSNSGFLVQVQQKPGTDRYEFVLIKD